MSLRLHPGERAQWRRLWKIRLIESMNPEWIDLFDEVTGEILDAPADLSRRTR